MPSDAKAFQSILDTLPEHWKEVVNKDLALLEGEHTGAASELIQQEVAQDREFAGNLDALMQDPARPPASEDAKEQAKRWLGEIKEQLDRQQKELEEDLTSRSTQIEKQKVIVEAAESDAKAVVEEVKGLRTKTDAALERRNALQKQLKDAEARGLTARVALIKGEYDAANGELTRLRSPELQTNLSKAIGEARKKWQEARDELRKKAAGSDSRETVDTKLKVVRKQLDYLSQLQEVLTSAYVAKAKPPRPQ